MRHPGSHRSARIHREHAHRHLHSPLRVGPPIVIIGAGPTGLSAAYHLGADALLIEQNDRVGGWCRSVKVNGFTFDWAGHILFSSEPYVHEMYDKLLGDNVHWQNREAWVYSKGVYTRYPFHESLYGLPADVIKECVVGAMEARFGELKAASDNGRGPDVHLPHERNGRNNGFTNDYASIGSANGTTTRQCNGVNDCCADGLLESTARLAAIGHRDREPDAPRNFEEFIYKAWGAGIARHFAIPFNRKLWAVDLKQMETSWLGGKVPMLDLEKIIEGALAPSSTPTGRDTRFGYPLHGGFQSLMDGFVPLLKGPLWLNRSVQSVSPARHRITLCDGQIVNYDRLISTMPLPALIRAMGGEAPDDIYRVASSLRHVSVRCVHLGIGRENLTNKHWVYYPEDTLFHRIFVQGNASPYCNPPDGFGLTCEITYSPDKPLPCDGPALIEKCVADCRRVGMFTDKDPIVASMQIDLPCAYVIYDHHRAETVDRIRRWLEERDILLAGRYSEWEHYNSDHAFLAGKKVAARCRETAHRAASLATI